MNFLINFLDLCRQVIPYFFRKEKFLGLLKSIVTPLKYVNDSLLYLRTETAFALAFNAQIIYLEKYLNEVYPNPGTYPNNIHILDGANVSFDYVWNFAELQQNLILYNYVENSQPVYLQNSAEQTGSFATSYLIRIPTFCQTANDYKGQLFNEQKFKKRVNFYNLAGKTYSIQYF